MCLPGTGRPEICCMKWEKQSDDLDWEGDGELEGEHEWGLKAERAEHI